MARAPKPDAQHDTKPKDEAAVLPPSLADGVGFAWVAESLMSMQHNLGEMKGTLDHVKASTDKHGSRIEHFGKVIYAASIVMGIIIVVGGFFINKAVDFLIAK